MAGCDSCWQEAKRRGREEASAPGGNMRRASGGSGRPCSASPLALATTRSNMPSKRVCQIIRVKPERFTEYCEVRPPSSSPMLLPH